MKILISGTTGLIGSALVPFLQEKGHDITRLVRPETSINPTDKKSLPSVTWNPLENEIELEKLNAFDAVIHLGGYNIGKGRWTDAVKKKIRDSRVLTTQFLSQSLAALKTPPAVFVCASALGYYGDRGDSPMSENCEPGDDFLSSVCSEWEAACQPARDAKIRTVNARIGVVISKEGGALKKMLTPFRWGVGGVAGSGKQYWSWVARDDVIHGISAILENKNYTGAVNLVSPNPVTNREFTKTLGKVLNRPTILPLPTFAIRLMLGEMGETLLLASTRVVPDALLANGFEFQHPQPKICH